MLFFKCFLGSDRKWRMIFCTLTFFHVAIFVSCVMEFSLTLLFPHTAGRFPLCRSVKNWWTVGFFIFYLAARFCSSKFADMKDSRCGEVLGERGSRRKEGG